MLLILENLTPNQYMVVTQLLLKTHKIGNIEQEFRVREKANDYAEDVEAWVKEEKE